MSQSFRAESNCSLRANFKASIALFVAECFFVTVHYSTIKILTTFNSVRVSYLITIHFGFPVFNFGFFPIIIWKNHGKFPRAGCLVDKTRILAEKILLLAINNKISTQLYQLRVAITFVSNSVQTKTTHNEWVFDSNFE